MVDIVNITISYIIEGLDKRESDNRGCTVRAEHCFNYCMMLTVNMHANTYMYSRSPKKVSVLLRVVLKYIVLRVDTVGGS